MKKSELDELFKQLEDLAAETEKLRQLRDRINQVLNEPFHVCPVHICTRRHYDEWWPGYPYYTLTSGNASGDFTAGSLDVLGWQ